MAGSECYSYSDSMITDPDIIEPDTNDEIEPVQHFESENSENLEFHEDILACGISEDQTRDASEEAKKVGPQSRFCRLPLSRIKSIMKMDPDVGLASSEAVFIVTKATELFLETIAKEAYSYTAKNKKKTVSKRDFDHVIDSLDCLCFLEGAMDF